MQYTNNYTAETQWYEILKTIEKDFISKFKFYSPFNAFLIHTQKRGAAYVATPQRWLNDYGRSIKPEAQPIVILQPMGPVITEEFEAETVSFMVCQRQGIQTTSPEYLSQFVKDHADIPAISTESVTKAAALIVSMSSQRLKLRKETLRLTVYPVIFMR